MSAQFRNPKPEETKRELLETLRFQIRDQIETLSIWERALAELVEQEGFGHDLRPETLDWARGGIRALVEGPPRRRLEVAR